MNLTISILVFLLVMTITEFINPTNYKLHNQLYSISFVVVLFASTIKYYYGPDILLFVPDYVDTPTISELAQGAKLKSDFEIGYSAFVILAKSIGVSYWGFTVIISILYFIALHKILSEISYYRILALSIIFTLDFTLVLVSTRQCLSVSFFLLMYVAYRDKSYIKMFIYAILTVLCHKSGILIGSLTFLLLLTSNRRYTQTTYSFILLFMMIVLLLPLDSILPYIVENLILDKSVAKSLQYHLAETKIAQSVLVMYLMYFLAFIYARPNTRFTENSKKITLLGLILIAILYQFFPIMWRLRQYFTPFFAVYIANILSENVEKQIMGEKPKQDLAIVLCCGILLFNIYTLSVAYKSQNTLRGKVYDTCTIFDTFDNNPQYVIEHQMDKAKTFWIFDLKRVSYEED